MKKLFLTSVVLCILGLVCFGISVGILGKRHSGSSYAYIDRSEYYGNGVGTIFRGDYSSSASWTIMNKFPDININSAGINTIITRGESDRITVRLNDPDQKTVHVEAVYDGNRLTIEARSTNITFVSDGTFGLVSWLEDIFTGSSSNTTVIIEFPEMLYNSLHIQQGSGSMKVHDLYAEYNNIHIGSGSFEFLRRSAGFVASTFEFELGSGKAVISGAQAEHYDIDIGSGSFDINGLSGYGIINMGSGSGSIAYKEYNGGCDLDIGSGNLRLFFPENSSVEINADIGSGKISIDACDIKADINSHNDDEYFHLGDGEYPLNIEMGSGKISILDLSEYAAPEITTIVISSYEGTTLISSDEFVYSENYSISSSVYGIVEEAPEYNFGNAASANISEITEPSKYPDIYELPEAQF